MRSSRLTLIVLFFCASYSQTFSLYDWNKNFFQDLGVDKAWQSGPQESRPLPYLLCFTVPPDLPSNVEVSWYVNNKFVRTSTEPFTERTYVITGTFNTREQCLADLTMCWTPSYEDRIKVVVCSPDEVYCPDWNLKFYANYQVNCAVFNQSKMKFSSVFPYTGMGSSLPIQNGKADLTVSPIEPAYDSWAGCEFYSFCAIVNDVYVPSSNEPYDMELTTSTFSFSKGTSYKFSWGVLFTDNSLLYISPISFKATEVSQVISGEVTSLVKKGISERPEPTSIKFGEQLTICFKTKISPLSNFILSGGGPFKNSARVIAIDQELGTIYESGDYNSYGYTKTEIKESDCIDFYPSAQMAGNHKYSIRFTTIDNAKYDYDSESSFVVCKDPDPVTLISPSNMEADVSINPLIEWKKVSGSELGFSCDPSNNTRKLLLFINSRKELLDNGQDPASFFPFTSQELLLTAKSIKLSGLALNEIYYWMIRVVSGSNERDSEVFSFTTRKHDCSVYGCSSEHSICVEEAYEIKCECQAGYSGVYCTVSDTSKLLMIVILCTAIPVFVILVVVFTVCWKVRRKRITTISFLKPDLTALAFEPAVQQTEIDDFSLVTENLMSTDPELNFYNIYKIIEASNGKEDKELILSSVCYCFAARGSIVNLLASVLMTEASLVDRVDRFFVDQTPATTLLQYYYRAIGLEYLWNTLYPVIYSVLKQEQSVSYKVQVKSVPMNSMSSRLEEEEEDEPTNDLELIQEIQVQLTAQSIIDRVVRSRSSVPAGIKSLLFLIRKELSQNYPDAYISIPICHLFIGKFILPSLCSRTFKLFDAMENTTRSVFFKASKMIRKAIFGELSKQSNTNAFIEENHDRLCTFMIDICNDGENIKSIPSVPIPAEQAARSSKVIEDEYNLISGNRSNIF